MDAFVNARNDELRVVNESNDVEFLKKELEKSFPECTAESIFRTNIKLRLKKLLNG